MPDDNATILLTRPRAQSERFAERCRDALPGVAIAISPILEVRFRSGPVDLSGAAGVILTSENGVRALAAAQSVSGIPAWCVGDRTAEAAAALGMAARSAAGSADDLVSLILSDRPGGPLVHVRGAESRGEVANRLGAAGVPVREAVLYDAVPAELSKDALALLTGRAPVVLPVFSPRAATLLGRAAAGANAPLALVAISRAAAENWTGPVPRYLHVCERPDAEAMLAGITEALRRYPA